jgi:hypothetical protein
LALFTGFATAALNLFKAAENPASRRVARLRDDPSFAVIAWTLLHGHSGVARGVCAFFRTKSGRLHSLPSHHFGEVGLTIFVDRGRWANCNGLKNRCAAEIFFLAPQRFFSVPQLAAPAMPALAHHLHTAVSAFCEYR